MVSLIRLIIKRGYMRVAAKMIGFLSSPPAYLALASSSGLLVSAARTTGVSYASGGAGILDILMAAIFADPQASGVHGHLRRVLRRRAAGRGGGMLARRRALRRPRPLLLLGRGAPYPAGRHAQSSGLLL